MIISPLAFQAYQALLYDFRDQRVCASQLADWIGCSTRGAAVALGELMEVGLAYRMARAYGLVEAPGTPLSIAYRHQVEALLGSLTHAEIAERLGLSRGVVAQVRRNEIRRRAAAKGRRRTPWRLAA